MRRDRECRYLRLVQRSDRRMSPQMLGGLEGPAADLTRWRRGGDLGEDLDLKIGSSMPMRRARTPRIADRLGSRLVPDSPSVWGSSRRHAFRHVPKLDLHR
jgi:hypothetical protein